MLTADEQRDSNHAAVHGGTCSIPPVSPTRCPCGVGPGVVVARRWSRPVSLARRARTADRGYAIGRPVGLLLVGWLAWWSGELKIVSFSEGAVPISLLIVAAGAIGIVVNHRRAFWAWLHRARGLLVLRNAVLGIVLRVRRGAMAESGPLAPRARWREADGLCLLERRCQDNVLPAPGPMVRGWHHQLLLLRFRPCQHRYPSDRDRAIGRLQPGAGCMVRVSGLGGIWPHARLVERHCCPRPTRTRPVLGALLGCIFVAVIGNLGEARLVLDALQAQSDLSFSERHTWARAAREKLHGLLTGSRTGKPLDHSARMVVLERNTGHQSSVNRTGADHGVPLVHVSVWRLARAFTCPAVHRRRSDVRRVVFCGRRPTAVGAARLLHARSRVAPGGRDRLAVATQHVGSADVHPACRCRIRAAGLAPPHSNFSRRAHLDTRPGGVVVGLGYLAFLPFHQRYAVSRGWPRAVDGQPHPVGGLPDAERFLPLHHFKRAVGRSSACPRLESGGARYACGAAFLVPTRPHATTPSTARHTPPCVRIGTLAARLRGRTGANTVDFRLEFAGRGSSCSSRWGCC